jgi:hypothetical protein
LIPVLSIPNRCTHFPVQDPPKFTQIGIFGLKMYHLATLVPTVGIQF